MATSDIQQQIDAFNQSGDGRIYKWRCTNFCSRIDFYAESWENDAWSAHYSIQGISTLHWHGMGHYNRDNNIGFRGSNVGPFYHYAWLNASLSGPTSTYLFDCTLTWLTFDGQCQSFHFEQLPYQEPVEVDQDLVPQSDYTADNVSGMSEALAHYWPQDSTVTEIEGLYHGDEVHIHFQDSLGQSRRIECSGLVHFEKSPAPKDASIHYTLQPNQVTANINCIQVSIPTVVLTFCCRGSVFRIEFIDLRLA